MARERIYLDHNATTPLDPRVLEAMLPFLRQDFGNPSSIHAEGRAARAAVDHARSQVAGAFGAAPEEIVFTSGGTESDNLALRGLARARRTAGKRLIVSAVEHQAVLHTARDLAREGFEAVLLPVDGSGRVDPQALRRELEKGDTALVSVIAASNEVGTLQPLEELGRLCREHEVPFHSDAVQAAGNLPLDLALLPVDLLSVSGHKLYGPKGVGALYLRRGVRLAPLLTGGEQERDRRAGTENVAGIVGLGTACELAAGLLEREAARKLALTQGFLEDLAARVERWRLNGHPTERLAGTLNLSFEAVGGEDLLLELDLAGIAASSGSACASGSLGPSHVLTAMGLPPATAMGAVRFSLGRGNDRGQLERVAEAVARAVARLRAL